MIETRNRGRKNSLKSCINSSQKKIILLPVLKGRKKSDIQYYSEVIAAIKVLMEIYFGLEVEIHSKQLEIKMKKGGEYKITGTEIGEEFELEYSKVKKNFSVFSFLDMMPKFITEETLSLVLLTDVELYENNPNQEIFGRVKNIYGKIAVVSLKNESDSETMITALHETMHTFGLSHCRTWDCIMNSKNDIDGYSCIHLCPLDLIKLKIINPKLDIINRFEKLIDIFKKYEWNNDVDEVKKALEIIRN
jgi:predicted Zn-dependent protease